MKRVEVVWEDASDLDEETWVPRAGASKPEPTIFHQIGYLYELAPDAVTLTACVGSDHMAGRSRIPAGMVKSIRELIEGEPVKIPKRKRKA